MAVAACLPCSPPSSSSQGGFLPGLGGVSPVMHEHQEQNLLEEQRDRVTWPSLRPQHRTPGPPVPFLRVCEHRARAIHRFPSRAAGSARLFQSPMTWVAASRR